MLRTDCLLAGIAAVCVTVGLSGCAETGDSAGQSAAHDADADHAGHDAEPGEYAQTLAKLSDADRAIAEKQKVCPVSGEPLGSMGVPVKVTVKDRDVLLCCEGCRAAIVDDPDTYLAKLDSN